MRKIIVDAHVGDSLNNTTEQVVVCDPAGRVIGFFSPLKDRPRLDELQLEPPLSIAETEKLRQQHRTGKPLEEILVRLGL